MKKTILGGAVVVVGAMLLFVVTAIGQPKSDLPEEYAEPAELPAGAITLEELDRRRAGGASPEMTPQAPPPMPAQAPLAAPPPMPPADNALPPPAVAPAPTVSDTRAAPVDWSKAPPEAEGVGSSAPAAPPPMAAPPPAAATMGAGGAGYSDLPEGYVEPTELPPGAVRIEDLQSPYGQMRSPTAQPSGGAPAAAPMAPPAERVETIGEESIGQDTYMPPSRWE